MNFSIVIALIVLALIALVATVWLFRSVAEDLYHMDDSSPQTEQRKNEKIRKEIERWRDGK
jgi:flagellar basal body-associated protein FliL